MEKFAKSFIQRNSNHLILVNYFSHEQNVTQMVKAWNNYENGKINPRLFDALLKAAQEHDIGKKRPWRLDPAGHPIPAPMHAAVSGNFYSGDDKCVKELISLHHNFSTAKIAEAIHVTNERDFPNALYVLITCDWLDSGVMSLLFDEDEGELTSHPFQEVTLINWRNNSELLEVYVEPWVFTHEFLCEVEYIRLEQTTFKDIASFEQVFKTRFETSGWEKHRYMVRGG